MTMLQEAAQVMRGDNHVLLQAVADWLEHEAEACGLNRSPFVDQGHNLAHEVARAALEGVTA